MIDPANHPENHGFWRFFDALALLSSYLMQFWLKTRRDRPSQIQFSSHEIQLGCHQISYYQIIEPH